MTETTAGQIVMPDTRWIVVPAEELGNRGDDVDLHTAVWPATDGASDDAPLQVAVHGLGASYLNWMLLAPLLTRFGAVWAPDLVGFGLSPLGARSSSIDDNAELLAGWIRTVAPGRRVLLYGNSMGGLLSLTVAGRHPELVAGVVAIDPALPRHRLSVPDPAVLAQFALFSVPPAGRWLLQRRQRRTTPMEQVELTLELCGVALDAVPPGYLAAAADMVARRRKMPYAHSAFLGAARSVALRTAVGHQRFWTDVDRIEAPTLVIHGERDRLVPVASAQALAERRPDWTLRIYRDVGHAPPIEVPGRVADDVAAWRRAALGGH